MMRSRSASESEKLAMALKRSLVREGQTGEEDETYQIVPNRNNLPEAGITEIRASQPVEAVYGTLDWAGFVDPYLVVPYACALDDDEDDEDGDSDFFDDDDDLDDEDDDLDDLEDEDEEEDDDEEEEEEEV